MLATYKIAHVRGYVVTIYYGEDGQPKSACYSTMNTRMGFRNIPLTGRIARDAIAVAAKQ
ncbi:MULTISPECIES: hypothetical protein [unclassified Cupriavidus]|uniref:hypothetical protein n=1 Tax=unclassified Cupriavidus TaxID=2640874 RepID=UPI00313D073B